MTRKQVKKPDPFDVALYGLVIAFGVGVVYLYQLLVMRDTMTVGQSAYIVAIEPSIAGTGTDVTKPFQRLPGQEIYIEVTLKNVGQTWARNVSGSINFLFGSGIPDGFKWPEDNHTQPVLVAPQGITVLNRPISDADLVRIKAHQTEFFVYGSATYQDVFDRTHKINYGFQYYGMALKPDHTLDKFLFWQGPQHNCADEDCK